MMPRRKITTLASLAALGTLVIGVTACSDAAGNDGKESPRSASADAVLAWARCMRAEGVDVPDPEIGADGSVQFPRLSGEDPSKREKAARKCRPLLSQGREDDVSEADIVEAQEKLLRYARCMRQKGIEMPDPKPPPQETEGPPVDVDDPRFQRADKECRKVLFPNGDVP